MVGTETGYVVLVLRVLTLFIYTVTVTVGVGDDLLLLTVWHGAEALQVKNRSFATRFEPPQPQPQKEKETSARGSGAGVRFKPRSPLARPHEHEGRCDVDNNLLMSITTVGDVAALEALWTQSRPPPRAHSPVERVRRRGIGYVYLRMRHPSRLWRQPRGPPA